MPLLPLRFFERDARIVARELLGATLQRDEVQLRITEVEAYCWPDDTANHCRVGRTARNAPMWGPGGHAYVYVCYGLHPMLNVVTNPEGEGAAVLVRACEPVHGLETIRARRGGRDGPVLLTGPGKVGVALGLDTSWSGHPLFEPGGLELHEGAPVEDVRIGPRVGIDYASGEHREAPWRFAVGGTRWVSRPGTLGPASTPGHGRPSAS